MGTTTTLQLQLKTPTKTTKRKEKAMTKNQMIEQAKLLRDDGVTKCEAYLQAVPLVISLRNEIKKMRKEIEELKELESLISDSAADYAKDHKSVMAVPISKDRNGIESGISIIDGERYSLTISSGESVREGGDNLTRDFLERLPKEFVKNRLVLKVSAFKGMSKEELNKYGLIRPDKKVWRKV